MGNYSKLIGALVGGVAGVAVNKFGLPAEWASPEIIGLVQTVLTGFAVYIFPPNQ